MLSSSAEKKPRGAKRGDHQIPKLKPVDLFPGITPEQFDFKIDPTLFDEEIDDSVSGYSDPILKTSGPAYAVFATEAEWERWLRASAFHPKTTATVSTLKPPNWPGSVDLELLLSTINYRQLAVDSKRERDDICSAVTESCTTIEGLSARIDHIVAAIAAVERISSVENQLVACKEKLRDTIDALTCFISVGESRVPEILKESFHSMDYAALKRAVAASTTEAGRSAALKVEIDRARAGQK